MVGRPASAQIVIVHARQIVVNQGVGVNALHGACSMDAGLTRAAAKLGSRKSQDWSEALSPGKDAVTHRLVDGGGLFRGLGEKYSECFVHFSSGLGQIGLKIHGWLLESEGAAAFGQTGKHFDVRDKLLKNPGKVEETDFKSEESVDTPPPFGRLRLRFLKILVRHSGVFQWRTEERSLARMWQVPG